MNASPTRVGQLIFAIPFFIFGAMHLIAAPELPGMALPAGSLTAPTQAPD